MAKTNWNWKAARASKAISGARAMASGVKNWIAIQFENDEEEENSAESAAQLTVTGTAAGARDNVREICSQPTELQE